ncbi:hypothetical protein E3N88_13397 [Mikania micrantha]|uniref:Uncharacterized protein n=1 Tax=Mikania micrantha TaxID=192012 RepID=A0A5N6P9I6_9ASTR|nr:hypothetical protein E3N88_13397 [Mikania micrantha]
MKILLNICPTVTEARGKENSWSSQSDKCKTFSFSDTKVVESFESEKGSLGCHLDLIELHEDSRGSQASIALPPLSQPSSNTVAMVKGAKGNSLCAIIGGFFFKLKEATFINGAKESLQEKMESNL